MMCKYISFILSVVLTLLICDHAHSQTPLPSVNAATTIDQCHVPGAISYTTCTVGQIGAFASGPGCGGGGIPCMPITGAGATAEALLSLSTAAKIPVGTLPNAVTVFCLGSSHCAYADTNSYGVYNAGTGTVTPNTPCTLNCNSYIDGSLMSWVSLYTNNKITRAPNTNNFGIYSVPLEGIAPGTAPFSTLVSAIQAAGGPVVVIEAGGTDNSAILGDTCAQIIALDDARNKQLLALGAVIIEETIMPRAASPNPFSSSVAQVASCFNSHLRNLVGQPGWGALYVADMDGVISDPAQTSGWLPKSGYLEPSGIHVSATGGSAAGYAVASYINALFPAWPSPWSNYADVYNATNNVKGNKLANPIFAGTSGTISGSGCSGVIPTNWALTCANAGGGTAIASIGTNTDGSPNITLTLGGTAAVTGDFIQVAGQANGGTFSAGESVQASAYLNWSGLANVNKLDLALQANGVGVLYHGGATAFNTPLPTAPACGASCFVQEEAPVHVVSTDTALSPIVYVGMNAGVVTGTIILRSMNLKQSTP